MDEKILIGEIMSKDLIVAKADEKITDVAEKLAKNKIHGVPVLRDGKLAGIITETDFFTKNVAGEMHLPSYINFLEKSGFPENNREIFEKVINSKAEDIMTSPCTTVRPETGIAQVIKILKEEKLTTIPVVNEEDNAVGIITTYDIINLI